MKIGLFSDGEWASEFIKSSISCRSIEIVFIVVRYNIISLHLQEFAKNNSINIYNFKNINSPEAIEIISKYKVDLFVSISYDQIFKRDALKIPKIF